MKKFLSLFLLLCLLMTLMPLALLPVSAATGTYSGGSGSQADPYRIATPEDFKALAKAVNGVVDPIQTVVFFLDAKGDHIAVAVAVGALIDQEQIVARIKRHLGAAAAVAQDVASPAVEDEFQGRTVGSVVVAPRQLQPVTGDDGDGFKGLVLQLVHQSNQRIFVNGILSLGIKITGISHFFVIRGIEGFSKDPARSAKRDGENQEKYSAKNEKGHSILLYTNFIIHHYITKSGSCQTVWNR